MRIDADVGAGIERRQHIVGVPRREDDETVFGAQGFDDRPDPRSVPAAFSGEAVEDRRHRLWCSFTLCLTPPGRHDDVRC